MKIDLRKSTIRLLKELENHCYAEQRRIHEISDMSHFEKGRAYAHMEIGTALNRILYKER